MNRNQAALNVTAAIALGMGVWWRSGTGEPPSADVSSALVDRGTEVPGSLEPVPSGHTARTDRGHTVVLHLIAASSPPDATVLDAER
ncbi:MAG TPA: hypothetical protein VEL79_07765, partial [Vicinamibacterales bacterium]|nr:hypothetical protein [Vicinamibacterales bacterium]